MEESYGKPAILLRKQKSIVAPIQIEQMAEFREYFNNIDEVLVNVNDNQQCALRKKYRYFLTKLQKLEQIEAELKERYEGIEQFVENSASIKQEKQSIKFIEMISTETLKKLGLLGEKVQKAKEVKKQNQKQILALKEEINRDKAEFFSLKKQQIQLLNEIQAQKTQNKLISAENKFRSIIKAKTFSKRKNKYQTQKMNKQSENKPIPHILINRHTEGQENNKDGQQLIQQPKTKQMPRIFNRTTTNFNASAYVKSNKSKGILSTLDQVCIMKESLMNQVENMGNQRNFCVRSRYEQLINNWEVQFQQKGVKVWLSQSKNPSFKSNKNIQGNTVNKLNLFPPTGKDKNKKTNPMHQVFFKNDCIGCDKKKQQVTNLTKQKYQLKPKQDRQCLPGDRTEDLIITDSLIQKFECKQQQKQHFLALTPHEIIKIVSQKNKIYELSKLIQQNMAKQCINMKKEIRHARQESSIVPVAALR